VEVARFCSVPFLSILTRVTVIASIISGVVIKIAQVVQDRSQTLLTLAFSPRSAMYRLYCCDACADPRLTVSTCIRDAGNRSCLERADDFQTRFRGPVNYGGMSKSVSVPLITE
jgi:hypothetical protein